MPPPPFRHPASMNMQITTTAIILALTACNKEVSSFHTARRRTQQQRHLNVAPQQLGEFEPITSDGSADGDRSRRRVWLYNFVNKDCTTIPYNDMWDHQKSLVNHQLRRIGKGPKDPPLYDQFLPIDLEFEGVIPPSLLGCDSVIMVEHDPVYTLGTASDGSFIHGYQADDDIEEVEKEGQIPIVRIERGGEVTYHGPGQLVVYPIIDLRGYKQDIHWYMRALEEVIILALEKAGVKGVSHLLRTLIVCSHTKTDLFPNVRQQEKMTSQGFGYPIRKSQRLELKHVDGLQCTGLPST
jgi:hypothetical protein